VPLLQGRTLPPVVLFAERSGPVAHEIVARAADRKWWIDRSLHSARSVDLTSDPAEAQPQPASLGFLLAAWEAQCRAPEARAFGVQADPAVAEKLRALGYVE
jgi:hypothetical protein